MIKFASREVFNVLHAVRDWTAKEIAETAGVSQSTVNNWRSGRTKWPRIDKLAAVAAVAGVRFALVQEDAYVLRGEIEAPKPRRSKVRDDFGVHA